MGRMASQQVRCVLVLLLAIFAPEAATGQSTGLRAGSARVDITPADVHPASRQIAAELGAPVENIVIAATHTHSGGRGDAAVRSKRRGAALELVSSTARS